MVRRSIPSRGAPAGPDRAGARLAASSAFRSSVLRARVVVVAILGVKIAAALTLQQQGWCLAFTPLKPMVRDSTGKPHSWDIRADWLADDPVCSAVMSRSYRDTFALAGLVFQPAAPRRCAASRGIWCGRDSGSGRSLRVRRRPGRRLTGHRDRAGAWARRCALMVRGSIRSSPGITGWHCRPARMASRWRPCWPASIGPSCRPGTVMRWSRCSSRRPPSSRRRDSIGASADRQLAAVAAVRWIGDRVAREFRAADGGPRVAGLECGGCGGGQRRRDDDPVRGGVVHRRGAHAPAFPVHPPAVSERARGVPVDRGAMARLLRGREPAPGRALDAIRRRQRRLPVSTLFLPHLHAAFLARGRTGDVLEPAVLSLDCRHAAHALR